jgi:hypothetical protein
MKEPLLKTSLLTFVISGIMEPFCELFFHINGFRLSQSLSRISLSHNRIATIMEPFTNFLSHDGISAITEPFTNFSFTRWNFGYHGAFHKLFFLMMKFRLSRSLSRTFLSHDGISAITRSLSRIFLSHDGILSIT